MLQRFEAGDVLFRQGDPSDYVVRVRSGSVEVLRESISDTVLLGTAHEGEYVGEMGVLEGRPRSAMIRAASGLEVELIERTAFIERVSRDPTLAHKLLVRMSARLRDVEDTLAQMHAAARAEGMAEGPLPAIDLPHIELSATTFAAKFYIGLEPIPIGHLPFTVGRRAGAHEITGARPSRVDLEIPEPEPYRLSRAHFRLEAHGERVVVRDLNSELGTIVNQTSLGHDFPADSAPLLPGDNAIIAGGKGSPFQFTITLA